MFNNNQKKPEFEFELGDVGESRAPQDWQRPKVNSIFVLMFQNDFFLLNIMFVVATKQLYVIESSRDSFSCTVFFFFNCGRKIRNIKFTLPTTSKHNTVNNKHTEPRILPLHPQNNLHLLCPVPLATTTLLPVSMSLTT